jgi:anti-sigma B factor antagonist
MTLHRPQVLFLSVSSGDHDKVSVVSLQGELDFRVSAALQAYFSGISLQTSLRTVADLADLDFLDCACLAVLVRLCQDIRSRGGSFALAGPVGEVHRILAVTGLLTWFDVHDTLAGAVLFTGIQRSADRGIPPGRDAAAATVRPVRVPAGRLAARRGR